MSNIMRTLIACVCFLPYVCMRALEASSASHHGARDLCRAVHPHRLPHLPGRAHGFLSEV